MDTQNEQIIHMAVIGPNGVITKRELPQHGSAISGNPGKVVFPFAHTAVHSGGWKASEHTCLIHKDSD